MLGRDLASLDAARGAGGPDLAFFLTFFASIGTARVASSASARISGKRGRILDDDSVVPTRQVMLICKNISGNVSNGSNNHLLFKIVKTNGGASTGGSQ